MYSIPSLERFLPCRNWNPSEPATIKSTITVCDHGSVSSAVKQLKKHRDVRGTLPQSIVAIAFEVRQHTRIDGVQRGAHLWTTRIACSGFPKYSSETLSISDCLREPIRFRTFRRRVFH